MFLDPLGVDMLRLGKYISRERNIKMVMKMVGSKKFISLFLWRRMKMVFFVVECPLLQGCYTQGKTLDEALKNSMWHKSDRSKKPLTIPNHKVLGKGLLRKLLRDAEISVEEFNELL